MVVGGNVCAISADIADVVGHLRGAVREGLPTYSHLVGGVVELVLVNDLLDELVAVWFIVCKIFLRRHHWLHHVPTALLLAAVLTQPGQSFPTDWRRVFSTGVLLLVRLSVIESVTSLTYWAVDCGLADGHLVEEVGFFVVEASIEEVLRMLL